MVVDDQNTHGHDFCESIESIRTTSWRFTRWIEIEWRTRERIQKLLVTGDNRLKQGVSPDKVRASYEEALEVAREAGLEERIRPLVEVRLADLERLSPGG